MPAAAFPPQTDLAQASTPQGGGNPYWQPTASSDDSTLAGSYPEVLDRSPELLAIHPYTGEPMGEEGSEKVQSPKVDPYAPSTGDLTVQAQVRVHPYTGEPMDREQGNQELATAGPYTPNVIGTANTESRERVTVHPYTGEITTPIEESQSDDPYGQN